MTNPDKVERLRELLGKATEGTWYQCLAQPSIIRDSVRGRPLLHCYNGGMPGDKAAAEANAALIAETINVLPALLAVVEAADKSATASMQMVAELDEFEGQPEYYGETVTPAFDCARNLRAALATLKGEG